MKENIDKIIEEVLASLALDDLKVSEEKIEEVKTNYKKLKLSKAYDDDKRKKI